MIGCRSCTEGEGEALMLTASALAAGIARGRSLEDISVLAALFSVMADQLALLAAVRARCQSEETLSAGTVPIVSSDPLP